MLTTIEVGLTAFMSKTPRSASKLKPNATVLDVACGLGLWARRLNKPWSVPNGTAQIKKGLATGHVILQDLTPAFPLLEG